MKKLLFTTALIVLLSTALSAQDVAKKKKPGFILNEQTMAELGVTPEQKKKIEDNRIVYKEELKKVLQEGAELDALCKMRIDSVLTETQKQKVTAMQSAIAAQNKENAAAKKKLVYDQKTMDELGLTPEQQKKLTTLKGNEQVAKWKHAQKLNKVMAEAFARENEILTEGQKQKAADMKTSIAEYNKGIM